ncbi:protein translocase subunit SecD [bacterium]|nr:protein translocase subunit SecD [bacterium]
MSSKPRSVLYMIGLLAAVILIPLAVIRTKGLKKGIDLSGGTILVYEIDSARQKTNIDIDELIAAIKRRINPDGMKDIMIRPIGSNRVEVIYPEATSEDVENTKRSITDQGLLQFRILATLKHEKLLLTDAMKENFLEWTNRKTTWAKYADVLTVTDRKDLKLSDRSLTDPTARWRKNEFVGWNVFVDGIDQQEELTVVSNDATTLTLSAAPGNASPTGFVLSNNKSQMGGFDPSAFKSAKEMNEAAATTPKDTPIVRDRTIMPGRVERYVLVLVPPDTQDVSGQYLARAYMAQDSRLNPAVGFAFNRRGAVKFGRLTREHLPEEGGNFKYRLAILLDDFVQSAPSLNSEISDSGIIEGGPSGFPVGEVNFLLSILNAGSLPATLNPVPLLEEKVGPTLGQDTIAKGIRAIIVSMIVVPIFMIVYYGKAGIIAVIGLVVNLVLLVGFMSLTSSTFTLPGLAGLALTIGMAVDANVLIFERMREEKDKGAGLREQVRNGFDRAWTTIFDANITTVLSGFVLFAIGTEEIKGFALTLIVGLVFNLFSAVYLSRQLFDSLVNSGWIKELHMLRFLATTKIDFVSARRLAATASLIVIGIGLAAFALRLSQGTMFNIDFTGGSLVTIRLNDADPSISGQSIDRRSAFVREKASALPDVTIESLNVENEKVGTRFNIRTSDEDVARVQKTVNEAFGSTLDRVSLTVGPRQAIAEPKPAEGAKAPATPASPWNASYELSLNVKQTASKLNQLLSQVLGDAAAGGKVDNPERAFSLSNTNSEALYQADLASDKFILRTNLAEEQASAKLKALSSAVANDPSLMFERLSNFGGTVAGETQKLAIIAIVASWAIIASYLWLRFKSWTYGFAAVLALVHDVLVALGAVALTYWLAQIPVISSLLMIEQFKIDLPMIAAFLTLIGFSVNDTIVIFDRLREIKGKTDKIDAKLVNDALNQTFSRTILTSLTAWSVVLIMYLFGGEGLHGFAFTLVVGFLSGTYSTIYIATPVLIGWLGHADQKSVSRDVASKSLAKA